MRIDGFLLEQEVYAVLSHLKAKAATSENAEINRIIFRLACCCGLRRKEISGLNISDVKVHTLKPVIHIRREITKGQVEFRRERRIPLWWDQNTLRDFTEWVEKRSRVDAPSGPFVAKYRRDQRGERMTEERIARRWRTAIGVLGKTRLEQVPIHAGRHSFVSHALRAGRSLVEVQHAAGHTSTKTTEIYLHMIERHDVPDLFAGDNQ
jgi:integrase